jgi:hypothetical protein
MKEAGTFLNWLSAEDYRRAGARPLDESIKFLRQSPRADADFPKVGTIRFPLLEMRVVGNRSLALDTAVER